MPRASYKTTVAHCWTLDLYSMLRQGMLVPGGVKNGTIRFSPSGVTMPYQALLRADGTGGIRIGFGRREDDGSIRSLECWVMMRSTPQPFGGRRWWFICPISHKLVAKVHLPGWSKQFASQKALGLSYSCQGESAKSRSIRKAWKLRDAIGASGIGEAVQKPKWMRWRTFYRLNARVQAADASSFARLAAGLSRFDRSMRG